MAIGVFDSGLGGLTVVRQIRRMPGVTFYPRGGSAMATVRQVGQAIAGYFGIGRKVRAPQGGMPANGWAL